MQPTNNALHIEDQPLFPPSSLPASGRGLTAHDLANIEMRLRDGQCRTALDGVRDLLLIKSRMLTYKNTNARHQGATTRARALLKKNDKKNNGFSQKYIDARRALVRLADGDESKVKWPLLDPGRDIRCLDDPDETRTRGRKRKHVDDEGIEGPGGGHLQECREATGEGRRTVSWIWKGMSVDTEGEDGVYHGEYPPGVQEVIAEP